MANHTGNETEAATSFDGDHVLPLSHMSASSMTGWPRLFCIVFDACVSTLAVQEYSKLRSSIPPVNPSIGIVPAQADTKPPTKAPTPTKVTSNQSGMACISSFQR